ncbi:MAG: hypothetical protein C4K49_06795, partial [Candidatus Thorarchaeota archaeon]
MMHGPGGPRALAGVREKRSRPTRLLLGRMIHYLGAFKRSVAIGAVFSLISTIITVFNPLVLTSGIDEVLSVSASFSSILFLVVLYLIMRIAAWVFGGVYTWILSSAQAGLVRNVQDDVYNHLVRADLSYHKSEQSGNITSRVTSDTDSLSIGIQVLIDFGGQILMLVSSFLILWFASPELALTSLVVIPGVLLIAVLFGTVGQRIMLASQRAYGHVSGQIAEDLSGIHIAKAFNRERELAAGMSELNQRAYGQGFKFMMLMSAMQPLVTAIGQFAIAAILFVAGTLVVQTLPLLSIGEVFLGILLIGRFMWPLLALVMNATAVQQSLAAMDRVSDVLESKAAITDKPGAMPLAEDSDGISFDDVTFSYVQGTPVLKNVSFSIAPGELVAVVGHTGAGKTTLAGLVDRFYDPDSGRILIGKQDLRNVTLESLHDTVSLVSQEPYLFDDTIMENIRYGRPGATDDEIIGLCSLLGANEFIEVLGNGYETKVIEGGKNLSAGQRQMITIARTMLADPRILILDEATSRLDAYSESLVQDAQARLFANRTTVVIAHRLTTIADASRILVFDHGKLIEEGTQDELLALNGTFKALYDTYYAHQGIEEITDEIVKTASEEVLKSGAEIIEPASPEMGSVQTVSGIDPTMGMGGEGYPNPEAMMQTVKIMPPEARKRMLENADVLPPEM